MNFILLSAVGCAFRVHGTRCDKAAVHIYVFISDRAVSIPPLSLSALITLNAAAISR